MKIAGDEGGAAGEVHLVTTACAWPQISDPRRRGRTYRLSMPSPLRAATLS
jgi:hypothetical protein